MGPESLGKSVLRRHCPDVPQRTILAELNRLQGAQVVIASTLVRTAESAGMEAALQPIVDLATGRVVGAEALARFPDRRSPELHFSEADTKGLRIDLELAAVDAALRRLSDLPAAAYLTVNVSPATAISPRLAALLDGAPAHRIVLELTEHAPGEDYPALEAALSRMRERGIRSAVDDAGAGFASLRHVLALRPDVLKLDVSITHGINGDLRRRELVRAMVAFSRATGCTLVAEGIETEDELDAVRSLGVRCGQGFRLGRPERDANGPWQIALPPMRWRPGRARPSVEKPRRRPVRMHRFVRAANIVLAAAIAWPGFASVAGLKAPSPGALRAPVAESRTDSGGSTQTRSSAPRPAAVKPVTTIARSAPAVPAVTRTVTSAPSLPVEETPKPVARTVQTLTSTVTGVVDATLTTVDTTVETVGEALGGVVSGLLGR